MARKKSSVAIYLTIALLSLLFILAYFFTQATEITPNFFSIPRSEQTQPVSSPEEGYPLEARSCDKDSDCVIFTCQCDVSLREDYKGLPLPPKNVCTVVCPTIPKCVDSLCSAVKPD